MRTEVLELRSRLSWYLASHVLERWYAFWSIAIRKMDFHEALLPRGLAHLLEYIIVVYRGNTRPH